MNDRTNRLTNNVNVTLHLNPLSENGSSYAKVQRNTAYIGNILDKAFEKNCMLERDEMLYAAGRLSEAMLSLLAEGKAVDVLEICIVYPKPESGIQTAAPGIKDVPAMKVGITPSEKTNKAVRGLSATADVTESSNPTVCELYDLHTCSSGTTVSAGYPVRLKGRKLKVAGVPEETGVFLAPCDEKGAYTDDSTRWIHIPAADLIDNTASRLLFNVPPELSGTYRVLIRTAYGSGNRVNKTVRMGMFEPVISVA